MKYFSAALGRGVILSTIGVSCSAFKFTPIFHAKCSTSNKLETSSAVVLRSVSDLRKEYSDKELNEKDIGDDPYNLFKIWFDDACRENVLEPNAMCLSTCKDNIPSVRLIFTSLL